MKLPTIITQHLKFNKQHKCFTWQQIRDYTKVRNAIHLTVIPYNCTQCGEVGWHLFCFGQKVQCGFFFTIWYPLETSEGKWKTVRIQCLSRNMSLLNFESSAKYRSIFFRQKMGAKVFLVAIEVVKRNRWQLGMAFSLTRCSNNLTYFGTINFWINWWWLIQVWNLDSVWNVSIRKSKLILRRYWLTILLE